MLGNISDEETNNLIYKISENVRKNLLGRSVVESELFPVTHYIHVACLILYDQSYQYNIIKEFSKKMSPEEIGRRSKTLAAYLNELYFNSFAMLYLHGRAMCIYDNIEKKKAGQKDIIVEPEEKKKQTKFLLDFWSRLCPNYRNDGKMTAEDGKICIISNDTVNSLLNEMKPAAREQVSKLKRAIGLLTSRNFLYSADCRAEIFEHGPYETGNEDELLIFKEFLNLHTGEDPFGFDEFLLPYQKTEVKSPYPNIIIGLTLKNMDKIQFTDWGTSFIEPSDFSNNITSIGLWTKELIHPKDIRYPDNLGKTIPLTFNALDELMEYSQKSLNEMYIKIAGWDLVEKTMAGVHVYTDFAGRFAPFAGMEKKWYWDWIQDVINNKQKSDLVSTKDVRRYIDGIGKYKHDLHPFLTRFFRSKGKRLKSPSYYKLQD